MIKIKKISRAELNYAGSPLANPTYETQLYSQLEQIPWVIVIQDHVMHFFWSPCFIDISYLTPFITTCQSCSGKWTNKTMVIMTSTSSTGINNTESSIYYLASPYISSLKEIAPLSPCGISASLSLLDSEWQNLRDSIVLESILLSKGQFASSKLSINCDT